MSRGASNTSTVPETSSLTVNLPLHECHCAGTFPDPQAQRDTTETHSKAVKDQHVLHKSDVNVSLENPEKPTQGQGEQQDPNRPVGSNPGPSGCKVTSQTLSNPGCPSQNKKKLLP